MKNAIRIEMDVTVYTTPEKHIEHMRALGAPSWSITREQFRTDMVRQALSTRTFLEWAHTFEEETEIMYVKGLLSGEAKKQLESLKERGVISNYFSI